MSMTPLFAETDWPATIQAFGVAISAILSAIAALYSVWNRTDSKEAVHQSTAAVGAVKEVAQSVSDVKTEVKAVASHVEKVEKAANGMVEKLVTEVRRASSAEAENVQRAKMEAEKAVDAAIAAEKIAAHAAGLLEGQAAERAKGQPVDAGAAPSKPNEGEEIRAGDNVRIEKD